MTDSLLNARQTTIAEMVATSFGAIAEHKSAANDEKLSGYVVLTGGTDCPVWFNLEAAKAGQFSISLRHATVFATEREARSVAANVKNGHGDTGMYVALRVAHSLEVANHERLIGQFIKAI